MVSCISLTNVVLSFIMLKDRSAIPHTHQPIHDKLVALVFRYARGGGGGARVCVCVGGGGVYQTSWNRNLIKCTKK